MDSALRLAPVRRSTSTSACRSRTRPATGPTSCRARASRCTPMPCGTGSSACSPSERRASRDHFNYLFLPFSARPGPSTAGRGCSRTTCLRRARTPTSPELCQPRGPPARGRRIRQPARDPLRACRRLRCRPPHLRFADVLRVRAPFPVRVGVRSRSRKRSARWRPYMARHRQNLLEAIPQRRHLALRRRLLGHGAGPPRAKARCARRAREARARVTRSTTGRSPNGCTDVRQLHVACAGQSWNAAAFLFAEHAVAATQALKRKVPPSSRCNTP